MPLDAGLDGESPGKVPKRADDHKCADRGHSSPEALGQVDVIGHNASSDEKVDRQHAPDRVQSLREQLKVLFGALLVKDRRGRGAHMTRGGTVRYYFNVHLVSSSY